jgi:hypothetical protein
VWSSIWNVDRGHKYLHLCGLPKEYVKKLHTCLQSMKSRLQ